VSLTVHQTTVLFISSHMAAFQNDVENRNRCRLLLLLLLLLLPLLPRALCLISKRRDYRSISAGLKVNPMEPGVESCESHHCCIWMGDLNYRFGVLFLFEYGPACMRDARMQNRHEA
jgi:hypothetical protein